MKKLMPFGSLIAACSLGATVVADAQNDSENENGSRTSPEGTRIQPTTGTVPDSAEVGSPNNGCCCCGCVTGIAITRHGEGEMNPLPLTIPTAAGNRPAVNAASRHTLM